MKKGFFIAFEGIDGTGKTTQLQLLAGFLRDRGYQVVTTREPTDSQYGRRIRDLYMDRDSYTLEEELNLFIQDRRQHVRELIEPQLAAGNIVLTDRYYFSTAAYQGAAGMDEQEIFARNSFAPEPDLVMLLTMDPQISIERIQQGRGEELNDFEQLDQLQKVASRFAAFDFPCIHRIDAGKKPSRVQERIQDIVTAFLEDNE